MKKFLTWLPFALCLLPTFAQRKPAPSVGRGTPAEQMVKQCDARKDESKEVTAIYLELFEKGASADGFARLGEQMLKISKPIQAEILFKKALKMDPKLDEAKKGAGNARKSLEKKNNLLKKYQEREANAVEAKPAEAKLAEAKPVDAKLAEAKQPEEKPKSKKLSLKDRKVRDVCRQAAILFHLGYMGDAVDILDTAKSHYGMDEEIMGLLRTFTLGINVERMVVREVLGDFQKAISTKNKAAALKAIAEFEYFSLGTGNTDTMVKKLADTFSGEIDPVKIKAVLSNGPV